MASIKINDLQAAGSDLFNDSESFMNELTENELASTQGGFTLIVFATVVAVVIVTAIAGPINKW